MRQIKNRLKKIDFIMQVYSFLFRAQQIYRGTKAKRINRLKLLLKIRFMYLNGNLSKDISENQFIFMMKKIKKIDFKIEKKSHFLGNPKYYYVTSIKGKDSKIIERWGNLTPDYDLFISNGINYYKSLIKEENYFRKQVGILYNEIDKKRLKLLKKLKKEVIKNPQNIFLKSQELFLEKVMLKGATSFLESLQMLFFIHQLLWIENNSLIGLGSLDQTLYKYYIKDLKKGKITKNDARLYLKDFLKNVGKNLEFKSSVILGDTGQAITIGGKKENELSLLILEAFEGLDIVSPKIIAKLGPNTSDEFYNKALTVLKGKTGSPLFINENLTIKGLKDYGYDKNDVDEFVTAACWEPLIPGKSFDLNIGVINFLDPLEKIIYNEDEEEINFDKLMNFYEKELRKLLKDQIEISNKTEFSPKILLSSLHEEALKKGQDISQGCLKYNSIGFLSVGFSNVVNAIYSLKELMKMQSKFQITDKVKNNNIEDYFNTIKEFSKFGQDSDEVDKIAIAISKIYYDELEKHSTRFGGKFKPGLGSASAYIDLKGMSKVNFDGRKEGEALSNNYSPQYGTKTDPVLTLNSLVKINLEKMVNGSIMDVTFNKNIIEKYPEKIKAYLDYFILKNGQSVQFNFLDYKELIDAQKYPEKYSNLIVRVWGMSSYFINLPKEFQDQIINRTKEDK